MNLNNTPTYLESRREKLMNDIYIVMVESHFWVKIIFILIECIDRFKRNEC